MRSCQEGRNNGLPANVGRHGPTYGDAHLASGNGILSALKVAAEEVMSQAVLAVQQGRRCQLDVKTIYVSFIIHYPRK